MELTEIATNKLWLADQAALMRMQLWFLGETHARMAELTKQTRAEVFERAGAEGKLDGTSAYLAQEGILGGWKETFGSWKELLGRAQTEAARLPFGVLAMYHERVVRPAVDKEMKERKELREQFVFDPQLQLVVDAAQKAILEDGLALDGRLWKMDRESQEGIKRVLMDGLTHGRSAWQIAKDLEQFLGADAEMPRWTTTRLYRLTKAAIAAGDEAGLIGEAGNGQGVAYNALRLARTEIQRAHGMATDAAMAKMPWIEKEQVHLSAEHPETDECDTVIAEGEDGDGIYPKGSIELPIHPNCLCYKTAVQDLKAFGDQLSEWVRTGRGFPAMDQYAASLGVKLSDSLMDEDTTKALGTWIDGSKSEIDVRMGI